MSLKTASNSDDMLSQLIELRKILAAAIDECESKRDLAALSRRYIDVIEAIDKRENGTDTDDEIATIILRNRQSATD